MCFPGDGSLAFKMNHKHYIPAIKDNFGVVVI